MKLVPAAAARQIPEGIRPTKVGVWFVVLTLVVGLAATNTGNNALYMVLALMLSTLLVSGVLSRGNVRGLTVEIVAPGEVFAGSPAAVRLRVRNRGRWLPRWLLLARIGDDLGTALLPYIPAQGEVEAPVSLRLDRRGRLEVANVHLATLFPLGLFRKGMRVPVGFEMVVYPRLAEGETPRGEAGHAQGSLASSRPGWGHDLHSLREMRVGDDPRRIHWKQSARTGRMIVMERESDESRRLSLVLDNAVDPASGEEGLRAFESRVSVAAASAIEHLADGWEVELVTRTTQVSWGSGSRQRRRVLEALALLAAAPADPRPLIAEGRREVRFGT